MTQAPPQPPVSAPAANPGKGLSIAGMVLGICGVALTCLWLSIPCGIVGLILSIIGKNKAKTVNAPTGMATAGIILSIIALALGIFYIIYAIVVVGAAVREFNIQMQRNSGGNSANELLNGLRLLF